MFKSSGIITYYPNWWAVIYVDDNIAKYYRHLLYWDQFIKLNKGRYPAHISLIYKEEPRKNKNDWGFNHLQDVEFEYDNNIQHDEGGLGYWINVKCDIFEKIRERFGLTMEYYTPHITIGNLKGII